MFPFRSSIAERGIWTSKFNFLQKNAVASIASTSICNPVPSGLYIILGYVATNTSGTGNVVTTISFTDDVGAKTLFLPSTLTLNANAFVTGMSVIQVASGSLSFSTTQQGTGSYNIYLAFHKVI